MCFAAGEKYEHPTAAKHKINCNTDKLNVLLYFESSNGRDPDS